MIWLNVTISDCISANVNPYGSQEGDKKDSDRAKIKTYLAIIMALFWAAVIQFS